MYRVFRKNFVIKTITSSKNLLGLSINFSYQYRNSKIFSSRVYRIFKNEFFEKDIYMNELKLDRIIHGEMMYSRKKKIFWYILISLVNISRYSSCNFISHKFIPRECCSESNMRNKLDT